MPLSDELKFCILFSGQYLTEMHSIAPCKLCYLFAATEAIGGYDGIAGGPLDGWYQHPIGQRFGNPVFVLLKTEWTRHAAAAGI